MTIYTLLAIVVVQAFAAGWYIRSNRKSVQLHSKWLISIDSRLDRLEKK